jgi:tetratricopeptide (TPR) repeat protein
MMTTKVGMPLAKQAALRALELDPTLGAGYAVLGSVQTIWDWDWQGAERSFRKALEVQPGLAIAHEFYSFTCLMPQRRFTEALTFTKRALQLNPFDMVLGAAAILTFIAVGDYGSALRHHEFAKEVNPDNPLAYGSMAIAHEVQGQTDEAIAMFRKACLLTRRAPFPVASLGHILAKSGERDEVNQILQELEKSSLPGFTMSLVNLGLGNTAEAIRWLEKGLEDHDPHALTVPFDPRFRTLFQHIEFRQLLDRMGLPHDIPA